MSVAQWTGVRKTYRQGWRRQKALESFDCSVASGETIAIVGDSGSGKTTAIRCLLGAVTPTSGSVSLMGKSPSSPQSRHEVGYLPEYFDPVPELSIAQLLRTLLHFKAITITDEELDDLLDRLNLEDLRNKSLEDCHPAERRRVGLAQAVAGRPELLVLDEPTEGLEPEAQAWFHQFLGRRADREATTVLVTRRLGEMNQLCDRAIHLRDGRITDEGTPGDILEGFLQSQTGDSPDD